MAAMRRYQNGSLELADTSAGPCWYIRFTTPDGKRPRLRVGLKSEFPSEAKASRAAQPIRERFNAGDFEPKPVYTVADAIDRYEKEEMPARYDTSRGYKQMHRLYIRPKWGEMPLDRIAPLDVRAWLKDLKLIDGTAASSRTRGHIHAQFKNLLKHAMLWNWMPRQVNPLALFSLEGATKRARAPRVVSPEQFRKLLKYFADDQLMLTLVTVAYCLGLRVSELMALKWSDIDHLAKTLHVQRSIVSGHVDNVKTERSNAPLPLAAPVAKVFLRWRSITPYRKDENWVFASKLKAGRMPMNPNKLQEKKLREAGKTIGLDFPLGWHAFRHSYKSLLDRVTADLVTKRDLMRHSDTHTTENIYGEVEMDRLRAANDAAVALAIPEAVN